MRRSLVSRQSAARHRKFASTGSRNKLAPIRARRLAVEFLEDRLTLSNTWVVTNTADGGEGSLRWAIEQANLDPERDLIQFDIPESDSGYDPSNGPSEAFTIRPLSALPEVVHPVIIDGYSQNGARPNENPVGSGLSAVLKIELDGSLAGPAQGIQLSGGNSVVRGLVVNRFAKNGILLKTLGGNSVQGNFIGTDVRGTTVLGNGEDGVRVRSSSNTIGVTGNDFMDRWEPNLITGNTGAGVKISGAEATQNVVAGNFIVSTRRARAHPVIAATGYKLTPGHRIT